MDLEVVLTSPNEMVYDAGQEEPVSRFHCRKAGAIGTAAFMAIGCRQPRICRTGRWPVGIATQDLELRARLEADAAARGLAVFPAATSAEISAFTRIGHA